MSRRSRSTAAAVPALAAAAAVVLALGGAAAATARAGADAQPADATVIAITGATVHTLAAAGTLHGATVVIAGGRIQAVGTGIAIPAGARRIDAAGKVVTPGLLDSETNLGLTEVGFGANANDASDTDPQMTASFDVSAAINPASMLFPIERVEGITRAISCPGGGPGLFRGEAAAIDLGGPHRTRIEAAVAQFVSLGAAPGGDDGGGGRGEGSRATAMLQLRRDLAAARDFDAHPAAYESPLRPATGLSAADLAALVPVVRGRRPLVVDVDRASDIEALLALAREEHLQLILSGAAEGWKVAPAIAAAHVPVLVNPLTNLPQFDSLGATLENAARLAKAGVVIAFQTGDSANSRNLRQAAGNAVAYGLPWDTALAAMTVTPARIWGLHDYGTLEPGKDADVVIWDGDPLELATSALHVFIRGVEMPQDSRQLRLRDRYLHRAAGAPPT